MTDRPHDPDVLRPGVRQHSGAPAADGGDAHADRRVGVLEGPKIALARAVAERLGEGWVAGGRVARR